MTKTKAIVLTAVGIAAFALIVKRARSQADPTTPSTGVLSDLGDYVANVISGAASWARGLSAPSPQDAATPTAVGNVPTSVISGVGGPSGGTGGGMGAVDAGPLVPGATAQPASGPTAPAVVVPLVTDGRKFVPESTQALGQQAPTPSLEPAASPSSVGSGFIGWARERLRGNAL